MTPPTIRSKANTTVGRVGVEDVASALVGEVVGHMVREEIEGVKEGEGL